MMGLKYDEIMHSTWFKLSFYDKAYELQIKRNDEIMYMNSVYTFKALQIALYNFGLGMSGKNTKSPMNYLDKPFMYHEKDLSEMTDEEYDMALMKAIEIEQQYMNRSTLPATVIARKGGKN